ncbi:MAG: RagB/SusD family nutrient uptake outer membrane protein, partial [Ekhidna sp.]
MKNYKSIKRYSALVLTIILFGLGACEDSLEIDVRDSFASDLVLSTPEQVELLLLTTYNSTESFGAGSQFWARYMNVEIASFEARMNFNATTQALDQFAVLRGWTSANVGQLGQKWQDLWTYVRQANVFLELVEGSEAQLNNPEEIEALKAEMRFLRANQYSKLLKFFGGVPLLTSAATLDDDFNIPRNSYQDVVDFIVSEIDAIAPLLPLARDSGEFGRATRLSALALKSRTLLYAASDLHDPSLAPQSSNLELYTYDKPNKWQDAAAAAKAVIDLVGDRDLISTPNAKAYQELFLSANEDILFARPFGGSVFGFGTDVTTQPDNAQSPRGFDGWSLSTPLHNYTLVYNMEDGSTTDSPSYDAANPYENREMRFYANINYQGANFRGRPIDYAISVDNTVVPDGLDSFSQDQQT